MATEPEVTTPAEDDPEYRKPNPQDNPRNIALAEIAASAAKKHGVDAAETAPSIDDEGNITPAPEPAPAATEEAPVVEAAPVVTTDGTETIEVVAPAAAPQPDAIDPAKMYKVKVDGQEMEVPGKAIIDAGYRTFQKETAADFRLKMASELLREAEAKARTATPPSAVATQPVLQVQDKSDADIANALQFGTPEQAAEAASILRGRGTQSQEDIQKFVQQTVRQTTKDELQFQDALKFVQTEYKDLLGNAHLKDLFFLRENQARAAGDRRPYADLYKAIGDDLRTAFKMTSPSASASGAPTPTGTVAARQALKRETAPVPRTAASRLNEAAETGKAKTPAEIIAGMAAARGKAQLGNNFRKG